ncbi:uncharacterized protein [Haliotis asinina]|uniref:uncharacterized protein n=1 Tax=Haliotis asinina TaxID=109174 RepID=UPI003531E7DF
MSHSDCLSFGFEPSLGLCHLHPEDSNTVPRDLVKKTGWKHSDISKWPKELMSPCAVHSCPPGRRCIMHRVTKAAICIEAHVYSCSEELLQHATFSDESKLTGRTRSCTCHSNYLDLPLDVLSVNNAYLKKRSLSTPKFNCSGKYFAFYSPVIKTDRFKQIPASSLRKIRRRASSIVFLVKACKYAMVALHTHNDKTNNETYTIVVGGYKNSVSYIRKCIGSGHKARHRESILSCHDFRPFWLSWKNDVISVGKGQIVGQKTFMKTVLSDPIVINHVSISSYIENKAMWLFRCQ